MHTHAFLLSPSASRHTVRGVMLQQKNFVRNVGVKWVVVRQETTGSAVHLICNISFLHLLYSMCVLTWLRCYDGGGGTHAAQSYILIKPFLRLSNKKWKLWIPSSVKLRKICCENSFVNGIVIKGLKNIKPWFICVLTVLCDTPKTSSRWALYLFVWNLFLFSTSKWLVKTLRIIVER